MSQSIVAISGSPSINSKSARLADHVLQKLDTQNLYTRHFALRSLPAEALVAADKCNSEIAEVLLAIEAADGLVISTPIYKASYSGLLKLFLDLLPQFALAGKAVLPIASGGSLAHVLALDYGLRPVLQSMGARHIVQSQFVLESHLLIVGGDVQIKDDAASAFYEAIRHFKHSVQGGPALCFRSWSTPWWACAPVTRASWT